MLTYTPCRKLFLYYYDVRVRVGYCDTVILCAFFDLFFLVHYCISKKNE